MVVTKAQTFPRSLFTRYQWEPQKVSNIPIDVGEGDRVGETGSRDHGALGSRAPIRLQGKGAR